MPTLSALVSRDPIRCLPYGVSGSAKTTLIGMMALHEELRPIYIFDFDLRISSLRVRIPKDCWDFIESDPYRDSRVPGEAFTLAEYKIGQLDPKKFKTVAVDSGTFMGDAVMARVLALDGKSVTSTPQLQHYMQQMSLIRDFVSKCCAQNWNFIFTCHEASDKDEVTGRMFKNLALTGKLAEKLPGFFNELWHTEIRQRTGQEPEYVVRCKSDLLYSARTSFRSVEQIEAQDKIWPKIIVEMKESTATSLPTGMSTATIALATVPMAAFVKL